MTVTRFGRILALPGAIGRICFGYVFGMASKGVPRHPQRVAKVTQRSPQRYQKVTQSLPKLTQRSQKYKKVSKRYPKVPPKVTQRLQNLIQRSQRSPQRCPKAKGGIPKVVPPLPFQRWRRRRRDSGLQSNITLWRHVKNDDSYTFWKDFGSCQGDSRDLFWACI